jgi:GT2 family glycosyltransferase
VLPPRPRATPLEEAPLNDRGGVYLTANAAFRRDVLLQVGGFDESFPYPAFEDTDLALELERLGRIVWAPDAVVVHPWRRMTWRATARRVRYIDSLLSVGQRHGCLGWRHHPTNWPRVRVIFATLITLPLGRILDSLRFLFRCPGDSMLRILYTIGEAALSLVRVPRWLATSAPGPRRSSVRSPFPRSEHANAAA